MTEHRDGESIVLSTVCRNYPPRPDSSIQWADGCFEVTGLPAVEKTSQNAQRKQPADLQSYVEKAVDLVKPKPLPVSVFREKCRAFGLTRDEVRAFVSMLVSNENLAVHEERGPGRHDKVIGTISAITALSGENGESGKSDVLAGQAAVPDVRAARAAAPLKAARAALNTAGRSQQ
jgi:hypothetical protein